LKPGGEIHLMDSPFYEEQEITGAKERTFRYYDSLGYPEMSEYYFHHNINDLKGFRHKIMQNPNSLFNILRGNQDCFYWICVKK
jgi:hypothetical protein